MKRAALLGIFAAAALLAQAPGPHGRGPMMWPGGPGGPGGPRPGEVVKNSPYSGERVTVTTQVLADGNTIQQRQQTNFYRDSQGRVRTERTEAAVNGQAARKHVAISDPVAGVEYSLDVESKTAVSMPRHFPGAHNGANPPVQPQARTRNAQQQTDPNVVRENLGTQVVSGVSATGTRTTRTIPAGAIGNAAPIRTVHETWYSDDLKTIVMSKTTDPRNGSTTMTLNNVLRVEPDASLFQVPSDFTQRRGPGGRGPGMRPGPPPKRNN